jgi:hypothetical protein
MARPEKLLQVMFYRVSEGIERVVYIMSEIIMNLFILSMHTV